MSNQWTVAELIDLDAFARLDHRADEENGEDLHERDRQIFLTACRQEKEVPLSHQRCLRCWLRWRRDHSAGENMPPGILLQKRLGLFRFLLLCAGLTAGVGLGASYFAYSGTTPLNVFTFFTLFLLPQLLLLIVLLFRSAIRSLMGGSLAQLNSLSRTVFHLFLRHSTPRSGYHSGSPDRLFQGHNIPLHWPLFLAGQWFGIAFNCGLIVITLFKVATSDLAFGWQTTLQFGPEFLHSIVTLLASPWSWLLPQHLSAPTLEQIEGSRIILKEGIEHLLTENLTSWWPFMLMSLIVYGLTPRIVLLFAGRRLRDAGFRRFLDQRRFQAISRRMQTPLVSTRGEAQHSPVHRQNQPDDDGENSNHSPPAIAEKALLLLPVDIAESPAMNRLIQGFSQHGYVIGEKRVIFGDYEEDMELVASLEGSGSPVILLLEAWMAPIGEQLDCICRLGASLSAAAPFFICLLGKPAPHRPLPPPTDSERRLWKKRIDGCGEGISYLDIRRILLNEAP